MTICKGCGGVVEDWVAQPILEDVPNANLYCIKCERAIPNNMTPGKKLIGLYPNFEWVDEKVFYQKRLGVALQLLRENGITVDWQKVGL
jgi:hypothetical protein